jgi:hypothetical protein
MKICAIFLLTILAIVLSGNLSGYFGGLNRFKCQLSDCTGSFLREVLLLSDDMMCLIPVAADNEEFADNEEKQNNSALSSLN